MNLQFDQARNHLRNHRSTWLITGVAGFIGSHLLETLLLLDQDVVGLDNFATGHHANLELVRDAVGEARWRTFRFVEGDIRDPHTCVKACEGVDYVLHQAALGSVPRSIENPLATNATNIDGFLNVLQASTQAGVRRFIYAASSSTYGDHPGLPKVEHRIGRPLSPYAVTKYVNELYADVFARTYGITTVGLRYFNVFGPRQDPAGAYAAVIPRWFGQFLRGQEVAINGDGTTSRDFCFVGNVVQANLLAALSERKDIAGEVFNVAVGARTTLNELFAMIRDQVAAYRPGAADQSPVFRAFRAGDVTHSQADIGKISEWLGYVPQVDVRTGLSIAAQYYFRAAAPA